MKKTCFIFFFTNKNIRKKVMEELKKMFMCSFFYKKNFVEKNSQDENCNALLKLFFLLFTIIYAQAKLHLLTVFKISTLCFCKFYALLIQRAL